MSPLMKWKIDDRKNKLCFISYMGGLIFA